MLQSVIQPATKKMKADIKGSRDVDGISEFHRAFISSLQTRCLLSKNLSPIHNTMVAMLDLAVQFHRLCVEEAKTRSFKLPSTVSVRRKRKLKSLAQARTPAEDISSSSDSEKEIVAADYDADSEPVVLAVESPQALLSEFDEHCNSVVAGLRGVSRAGGEESWGMLADRLDWKNFSRKST
jgi:gamma-tubulin complex component 5